MHTKSTQHTRKYTRIIVTDVGLVVVVPLLWGHHQLEGDTPSLTARLGGHVAPSQQLVVLPQVHHAVVGAGVVGDVHKNLPGGDSHALWNQGGGG